MIRDAVRAEIEDAKKKLPAFLQPDEDEEEEGDGDEDAEDASDTDAEASAETDEAPAASAATDGTEPSTEPVESGPDNVEVHDENDDWLSLVDRLTDTPSPSADDAFQSLKEAWL
jgi:hypothetical protein